MYWCNAYLHDGWLPQLRRGRGQPLRQPEHQLEMLRLCWELSDTSTLGKYIKLASFNKDLLGLF